MRTMAKATATPARRHAGHDPELFRHRFWLSLALTVPVVLTSELVMEWFGYSLSHVGWVGPVLGTSCSSTAASRS